VKEREMVLKKHARRCWERPPMSAPPSPPAAPNPAHRTHPPQTITRKPPFWPGEIRNPEEIVRHPARLWQAPIQGSALFFPAPMAPRNLPPASFPTWPGGGGAPRQLPPAPQRPAFCRPSRTAGSASPKNVGGPFFPAHAMNCHPPRPLAWRPTTAPIRPWRACAHFRAVRQPATAQQSRRVI